MGQSKIPFYVFVDETGNTGHNLFDNAQPDYFSGALISVGDFDKQHGQQIREIAKELGVVSLHAQELGIRRIEEIADRLIQLLTSSKLHFFVSRVEKRYLLASKMFDVLFDSGENAAVAWHHYNMRPMRLLLAFKLSALIDEDIAKLFWNAVIAPDKNKVQATIAEVCNELLKNIDRLPDAASRRAISEGLSWAAKYPESIHLHTDQKIARQGHFPNMVSFANLLDGLEHLSKLRKKKVHKITHDKQNEFEKSLSIWHEMFSNADPQEIRWAGETYSLQKVQGSTFEVSTDEDSVGIQVTDVVLWLYSQFRKSKKLPKNCEELVHLMLSIGWENDFSFDGVQRAFLEKFGPIISTPLPRDVEEKTRKMLEKAELRRKESMEQYEKDRLPPFERHLLVSKGDTSNAK